MSEELMVDDELGPIRLVRLLSDSGDSMSMQVAAEFEYEGRMYGVLTPAEPLVKILKDAEEELEEIELEHFAALKKHINKALKDFGLSVVIRADEFVLEGEEPDDLYEDCDVLEAEGDDGPEELFVIAEVDTGEANYLVVTSSELRLYPVYLNDDETARSLTDEEFAAMDPVFKEVMQFDEAELQA